MKKSPIVLFLAITIFAVFTVKSSSRADVVKDEEFPASVEGLKAALNEALEENARDFNQRLALAAHIYDVASSYPADSEELIFTARYVEAKAHMRLGDISKSTQQAKLLCPEIDRATYEVLRFRCDALEGVLMFVRGERKGALEALDVLFSRDNRTIPKKLLAYKQVSYAAIMNADGRSAEAVDLYERLLIDAIDNQYDSLALIAGNNLAVILITLQDYAAAQRTLDQLDPIIALNPDSLVFGSLRLHQLELQRVAGKTQSAIRGLTEFIENKTDSTPLMLGSAHRLLADALIDDGQFEAAVSRGQQAVRLLKDHAHELSDVHVTLARTYIHLEDFDAALEQLASVDIDKEAVPWRRANINRTRLEAILGRSGYTEAAEVFEALVASEAEKDVLASSTRAEYYEARLKTSQRALELRKAEELAREQAARHAAQRDNTRLVLWLIGASALVVCVAVAAYLSYREEGRRLAQERKQNKKLEELVEQKTEELMTNLDAQAALSAQYERQKRVEATGKLVGNVAHDFNNLLQVVSMSNETIACTVSSDQDKANALALSDQALVHGARILRQLMAYSRQQDLEPRTLCFERYLIESMALLRFAVGAENSLVLDDRSEGATILVDSAQLTTSILNLISNAADSMPRGGTVVLGARLFEVNDADEYRTSTLKPGEYLVISVTDDGEGMNSYEIDRAVEPFFTTKEEHAGTGLGLSSVYGFVKQTGGDLHIRSEVGKGTTVDLFIPTVSESLSVEVRPKMRQPESRPLAGLRLLLVEDHEQVAGMLEAMLRALEMEVFRVANALEAQARLIEDEFQYDFVFSDIRMPGDIDGWQLAVWVREKAPQLRILLMSGFNDSNVDQQEFELLQKPFTGVDMAKALTDLLSETDG